MSATLAIAESIREAHATGAPLRLTGSGTWLDAGRPARDAVTLPLASTRGVIQYEPGDLTLTVGAGTTLGELRELTAANRQWIPLDPFGGDEGSIGASVATSSCGPLATGFGTPRDQVLGCTFVTGAGDVVTAGGRVVKNVAGFDLTRLMIGAWGTLGAITEVSLRVRALPDEDVTCLLPLADGPSVQRAWRWLRDSEFRPMAAEMCSPRLSAILGLGSGTTLAVRLGGSAVLVSAAQSSLSSLGSVSLAGDHLWSGLRAMEPAGSSVLRLSTRPSRTAELWAEVSATCEAAEGWTSATLARGVLRCVVPSSGRAITAFERLRAHHATNAACIVERASDEAWRSVPSAVTDELSRRVRATFDPARVLNRGILGEAS